LEAQADRIFRSGVVWNRIPFALPVIPATAGIQSVGGAFPMACEVNSRLRGNDGTWARPYLANESTIGFLFRPRAFQATLEAAAL
jgi:hypothetical protein